MIIIFPFLIFRIYFERIEFLRITVRITYNAMTENISRIVSASSLSFLSLSSLLNTTQPFSILLQVEEFEKLTHPYSTVLYIFWFLLLSSVAREGDNALRSTISISTVRAIAFIFSPKSSAGKRFYTFCYQLVYQLLEKL